jgi:hypothetical protein
MKSHLVGQIAIKSFALSKSGEATPHPSNSSCELPARDRSERPLSL